MYRSTRYFQVTPEILLEYDYATNYSLYNQDGDVSDVLIDWNGDRVISTLDNAYDSTIITQKDLDSKNSIEQGIFLLMMLLMVSILVRIILSHQYHQQRVSS